MSNLPSNYFSLVIDLKERIRSARYKTSLVVNREMLLLYWEIGNTISEQQKTEGWGTKVIDRLSVDLRTEFPDFKGLSVRNLKYMKTFAEAYPQFMQQAITQIKDTNNQITTFGQGIPAQIEKEGNTIGQGIPAQFQGNENQKDIIIQRSVGQLSWYHHQTLLDKLKNPNERYFYILETIKNGWSRDIMLRNIESKLHERQGNAITNFQFTLPAIQSDLAQQTIKSPYNFDFIAFGDEMKERHLEKALIEHLKKFMLELGKGFAYVGNQYNLMVEGDEYFLDLLFFNTELNCYVIFELKVGDFKSEFAGKLNFYVNVVDAQLKKEHHHKTIGVLLCKTPNETVVKYSLQGIDSPIGVSQYELAHVLPANINADILSIEAVEEEMEREMEELKTPAQKKFEALKEKLSQFNNTELKQEKNTNAIQELIATSFIPLYETMITQFKEFESYFLKTGQTWNNNHVSLTTLEDVRSEWVKEENLQNVYELRFTYYLDGFINVGIHTFNIRKSIEIRFSQYFYEVYLESGQNKEVYIKKLYTEQIHKAEIGELVDKLYGEVVDELDNAVKKEE
jgi:predicted nuclease of restriction endonuclease-like (RecB) superfamily